jgi:RimJ/RimL family protein N-acetyltransferase
MTKNLTENSLFTSMLVLRNKRVELQPLSLSHIEDLSLVAYDPEIWQYGTRIVRDKDELISYVDDAITDRRAKISYPYAIIDTETGKAVGSTRFCRFSWQNSRVEIGYSWIGAAYRGTGLNKAVKFAMLEFAFKQLKFVRVELRTDLRNVRSQRAIAALGAIEEGILRKHLVNWDGFRRDTVYFGMLDTDWEASKHRLINPELIQSI